MAKFLVEATYNAEGTKGLMKEGGSSRRTAVKKAVEDLGGTLEAFHFVFGERDAIVICDVPDTISAIAIAMAVDASGEVTVKTTPLISPEEIDAACHKAVPLPRAWTVGARWLRRQPQSHREPQSQDAPTALAWRRGEAAGVERGRAETESRRCSRLLSPCVHAPRLSAATRRRQASAVQARASLPTQRTPP